MSSVLVKTLQDVVRETQVAIPMAEALVFNVALIHAAEGPAARCHNLPAGSQSRPMETLKGPLVDEAQLWSAANHADIVAKTFMKFLSHACNASIQDTADYKAFKLQAQTTQAQPQVQPQVQVQAQPQVQVQAQSVECVVPPGTRRIRFETYAAYGGSRGTSVKTLVCSCLAVAVGVWLATRRGKGRAWVLLVGLGLVAALVLATKPSSSEMFTYMGKNNEPFITGDDHADDPESLAAKVTETYVYNLKTLFSMAKQAKQAGVSSSLGGQQQIVDFMEKTVVALTLMSYLEALKEQMRVSSRVDCAKVSARAREINGPAQAGVLAGGAEAVAFEALCVAIDQWMANTHCKASWTSNAKALAADLRAAYGVFDMGGLNSARSLTGAM